MARAAKAEKPKKATRSRQTSTKVVSIQAATGRSQKSSGRSHVARLNDETKKHAYNHGMPWSDDEVSTLLNLIDRDQTTYDMALATGRTYYAAQYARAHAAFAQRHARVFKKYL